MPRDVKMLGRMLTRRRIATADMAAGQALPKVHPPAANLQAFFTSVGTRLNVRIDRIQMGARHVSVHFLTDSR